jgi:hypothetical protein
VGFQKCRLTPDGARGLIVVCRAVVIEVDELGLMSKRLSGDVIFGGMRWDSLTSIHHLSIYQVAPVH